MFVCWQPLNELAAGKKKRGAFSDIHLQIITKSIDIILLQPFFFFFLRNVENVGTTLTVGYCVESTQKQATNAAFVMRTKVTTTTGVVL